MKKLYFILFIVIACEAPHTDLTYAQLQGTWLSTTYTADLDSELPFSQFMEFNEEGELRYLSGNYRDTFQPVELMEDSIKFPYRTYPRGHLRLDGDILSIGTTNPWKITKVDAQPVEQDSAEIKAGLVLGQWISDDETLQFTQDKIIRHHHGRDEVDEMCWDVYALDDYKFIQLKGSFLECDGFMRELILIRSFSSDSILLDMWRDGEMATLTYKKAERELLGANAQRFRLCNPFISEHSRSAWHHFKYAGFESGLYGLEKIYSERFQLVKGGRNTGLVRVQFVINCLGEIGNIEAYDMTENYEKTQLNPQIREQILRILPLAGSWVPGERGGVRFDAYKYLIFRIKDGAVDEIFP